LEKLLSYLCNGLSKTDFDQIWYDNAVVPLQPSDRLKFQILKIQDGGGRHLEKSKNRHVSVAVLAISTKFGKATQFGHLEPSDHEKFKI